MKNKAVFIDRDGTLIREAGYLSSLKKVHIYKNSIKALEMLEKNGYMPIIISNQSGVARGYFTEDFVRKTHKYIDGLLEKQGVKIYAYYYCPHHTKDVKVKKYFKDCNDRKPKTGMVMKAKKRFDIDLKNSFAIGDKLTDVKLAKNSGMKGILVLTGFGKEERKLAKKQNVKPDYIAKDLLQAAEWIVKK